MKFYFIPNNQYKKFSLKFTKKIVDIIHLITFFIKLRYFRQKTPQVQLFQINEPVFYIFCL